MTFYNVKELSKMYGFKPGALNGMEI